MDALLDWIARTTGATSVRRGPRIQALWGGYGEIFRVYFTGIDRETAIVKRVAPPASGDDEGHARKLRSYEVEAAWYRRFAPRCGEACRVAALLGLREDATERSFLFEDLDAAGFAERRPGTTPAEIDACLRWLAALHATFLGEAPEGLWFQGTYWHLATRRRELEAVADAELARAAPALDEKLQNARFRTLLHGDPKAENFGFAPGAARVAAVDFQYAGGGCGMKDVAHFLWGSVAVDEMGGELARYFDHLRRELGARGVDPEPVVAEWSALFPIAFADFARFLAGWAPRSWAADREAQAYVRELLRKPKSF
jgi:aminoglycoside phosphotransferase (APT) family kinase protein